MPTFEPQDLAMSHILTAGRSLRHSAWHKPSFVDTGLSLLVLGVLVVSVSLSRGKRLDLERSLAF